MYPYGFVCSTLVPLLGGFGARIAPDLNTKTLDYYYAKDSEVVCAHPNFLEITQRQLSADVRLPSLKTVLCGGDFLSAKRSRKAAWFFRQHGAFGATICNGSGTCETLGASTNAMGAPYRPETVGQLMLGPKYLVMNKDTMSETKYGEAGELWTAGKHVFKEYYHDPVTTQKAKISYQGTEYYRTGIYGFVDEDRYFTLIGRAARFFITSPEDGGSYKVYCEYVQTALSDLNMVHDCVVVDTNDPVCVKAGKAYVKLEDNVEASETTKNQILDLLAQNSPLKPYEIPKSITFVEQFPHTKAGKVDYEALRKLAKQENNI